MTRFELKLFLAGYLACSCFLVATVFAQTASVDANLTTNPVYKKDCAKCHGKTAKGRHFGGPSLASEKAESASIDDLRNIVTDGKGRMPKYSGKLTPGEINTLVQQIKALSKK